MTKIESKPSTDSLDRLQPLQSTVNPDWLTQRIMLTTDLSALSILSSLNSAHGFSPSDSLVTCFVLHLCVATITIQCSLNISRSGKLWFLEIEIHGYGVVFSISITFKNNVCATPKVIGIYLSRFQKEEG